MQTSKAIHPVSLRSPQTLTSARTVEGIHRGGPVHWVGDGFRVRTVFPGQNLSSERVSPFVLLDHHPAYVYPALAEGQRGVGWHPHRGFETVTLAWQGSVAHRDTAGHSGVIHAGDVQWMTAASGVLHEEYHAPGFSRAGGPFEMLQLWVNLPAKDKMAAPDYQPITSAQIPVVPLEGEAGTVRVIAGAFGDVKGPARTFTPITMLDVRLSASGQFTAPLPAHHNALVLVAEGRVRVGGREASTGEVVVLANDGPHVELQATAETHLVLLAGEPIDEPIFQYGPFVMNTEAEIIQAVNDVNAGKFGPIPD